MVCHGLNRLGRRNRLKDMENLATPAQTETQLGSAPFILPASAPARDHSVSDRIVACGFAGDAAVGALSFLLAYWLRFHCMPVGSLVNTPIVLRTYYPHLAVGLLAFLSCLGWFGIYNPKLLLNLDATFSMLLRAFALWLFLYPGVALLFQLQPALSRGFVALSAAIIFGVTFTWRWAFYRIVSSATLAGNLRQRIVFVGWTPEAGRLAQLVWHNQAEPHEIVGYFDFSAGNGQVTAPANVPYLGDYSELPEVLLTERIDIALLTDLNADSDAILHLSTLCEKEMVEFKIIPSYFQILVSGLHLESLSGTPVLGISALPLSRLHNRALKRLLDICGALIGLLIASPIIAVFGALVYMESPGSIFYFQRRLGRKGRLFDMIKIRSMRLDAEKDGKVGWSVKGDPRRLRIGTFMRKWNIDEVPQFWNVLKGDMSLVGPRPERPELIKDFKHEIEHYNARHTVKPGITGWAQVNGLRGDTDLTERIQHDLFYVENWNVLLDVQTMLLTFLKHENAC